MSELYLGDCLDVLKTLPDNSVDSVVTDPPYGLGFMGVKWDTYANAKGRGPSSKVKFDQVGGNSHARKPGGVELIRGKENRRFQQSATAWFESILRVAKPGAHILAFGGTRTFHRLACAIEDAGWEVRDTVMWVYAQGFPKSLNLDGDWQGWGTALKPAWEPIIVARKPLIGTVAENVMAHGTGALNIDASRIPTEEPLAGGSSFGERKTPMTGDNRTGAALSMFAEGAKRAQPWEQPQGRWPANLIHDGSEEVVGLFPDSKDGVAVGGKGRSASIYGTKTGGDKTENHGYGGSGSAARFFYCAKASRSDRGEGNGHPTVKPTDLMRYLCRLITPPGGTVLDPFMGSGSTGKAAVLEGFDFIGIEREAEYLEIAKVRIAAAEPQQLAMAV